jgi:hypothetical protein
LWRHNLTHMDNHMDNSYSRGSRAYRVRRFRVCCRTGKPPKRFSNSLVRFLGNQPSRPIRSFKSTNR